MKRAALIIFMMLAVFDTLYGQEDLGERKNIIFFELYGAANLGVGLGYERYVLMTKLFRYSMRVGLSHDSDYKHVPAFVGNSLMFGKRHNIEIGLNLLIKYPQIVEVDNSGFDFDKEMGPDNYPFKQIVKRRNIFNPLLGYRYQSNRIMVRTFIGTPIEDGRYFSIGPHVGASFGLSF